MAQMLGQVAEGQLVKLNESGKPVEFYVAKQNYESGLNGAGLVLLVRKDVYQNGQWNSENINNYAESTILNWSNNTYRLKLDPWVYSSTGIVSTSIRVTNSNKTVENRKVIVFQLSLAELGLGHVDANSEGSILPIYRTLKIANYQGAPTSQWTRTPTKNNNTNAFSVSSSGSPNIGNCTASFGYRPCFCLKSNVYVSDDGTLSEPIETPKSITVPPNAMQGQPINVLWESASGVDSYILQRIKSGFWEQVYAGNDTEYTDTAGDWTTVQYRVCSVFNGANSDFKVSSTVNVVSASALVISGQDGDLGTITNDIPYSVNSNTGNDITLVRTVNGAQVATATVQNGFSYNIPVLDLPTGTNTIVITATVTASSGQVTATRKWTYTKPAQPFPASGGVAALTKDGKPLFPQTLAECVRTIGGPWGGDLGKALEKLARAAMFSRDRQAKYTEVKVDLGKVKAGDIVNLPVKGIMTPHIVVQVGNPDPAMYDASCDGVWLLWQNIVENGQWNSTNVNTLAGSTIMTTMQGYVTDYDSTVQAAMLTVKIPYCTGGGNTTINTLANGLQCKMFPLSGYEVGWTTITDQYFPVDGVVLSYFQGATSSKRVAYLNENRNSWSLRSPRINYTDSNWMVAQYGNQSYGLVTGSNGIRPCFLLPTTFTATYYVDDAGTVHPEQEYTNGGDFYDLWGEVIPTVKIATGSYVGTGTHGRGSPNTLIVPKNTFMVAIKATSSPIHFVLFFPTFCSETYSEYNSIFFSLSLNTLYTNQSTLNTKLVGDELYWYANNNNIDAQLNVSGTTYRYTMISIN